MESTETPELSTHEENGTELERAEVDWLLTSGVFGRAVNLIRVLRYICAEHFQGRTEQIKEYKIAVEALGRRREFDPQTDTIVRVTVHALRKRLLEIYEHEGADRPVRLVIPPGRYAPSFIHRQPGDSAVTEPFAATNIAGSETPPLWEFADGDRPAVAAQPQPGSYWRRHWIILCLIAAIAAGTAWLARKEWTKRLRPSISSAGAAVPAASAEIRALMGRGGRTYVDHSGKTWTAGNYCQGGGNVSVPPQRIEGTEDEPLYLDGVRGIAHCVFPITPGLHEIHFYFAEVSELQAATHVATISVNAGPRINVDVVDDAGGDRIATSKVVTAIAAESDGAIHVDFVSEVSLLNAVEILPAPSAKMLPVRIVAGPKSFLDPANQLWLSDRYFSGGRHGLSPEPTNGGSLGIYASDRVGRFRYAIPAVPLGHYRIRLYFREPWFGKENGGPGSRIFDVTCNGSLLLKNFDILAEAGSEPLVKTFDNIQASASGRIDLSFEPVVNYPVINAIEVLAF